MKNFARNLLISPRSTWKGRGVEQQGTQRLSFVGGEGEGGQSTVTLEMISNDLRRITCDNFDPGGSQLSHLGKDQR